MATQICYTVGSNSSFEAAKRCQAVLEQDILCNRARIELVKKVLNTGSSLWPEAGLPVCQ